MSELIKIYTTGRGDPAVWETGGWLRYDGSATIITKADGSKPRAAAVRIRRGYMFGNRHALVPVHEGYYIIDASIVNYSRSVVIRRIVSIVVKNINGKKFEATAEMEVVNTFYRGKWDEPLDAKLKDAVEVAIRKASIYHRYSSAMYIDMTEQRSRRRKRRTAKLAKQGAGQDDRLCADGAAGGVRSKTGAETEAPVVGAISDIDDVIDEIRRQFIELTVRAEKLGFSVTFDGTSVSLLRREDGSCVRFIHSHQSLSDYLGIVEAAPGNNR